MTQPTSNPSESLLSHPTHPSVNLFKLPEISVQPTTLGNQLQSRILSSIRVGNLLLAYLCILSTIRWVALGN